ncbi:MAG: hypothetical protein ACRCT1_01890 [Microcoleaceae cyanobacterium]
MQERRDRTDEDFPHGLTVNLTPKLMRFTKKKRVTEANGGFTEAHRRLNRRLECLLYKKPEATEAKT